MFTRDVLLALAHRIRSSLVTRRPAFRCRDAYPETGFLAIRTMHWRNPRALLTYESLDLSAKGGEAALVLPAGHR